MRKFTVVLDVYLDDTYIGDENDIIADMTELMCDGIYFHDSNGRTKVDTVVSSVKKKELE